MTKKRRKVVVLLNDGNGEHRIKLVEPRPKEDTQKEKGDTQNG